MAESTKTPKPKPIPKEKPPIEETKVIEIPKPFVPYWRY
jgi:hypothetical protein